MPLEELKESYIYSLTILKECLEMAIEEANSGIVRFNPVRGNIIPHISEMYGYFYHLDKLKEDEKD